ncbi:MAG: C40 family peptidase [Bacteroidales bacterium]|nr:C40 family peptidase [Bacteroidales bacterium]
MKQTALCAVGVLPVRQQPASSSEQTTQLLFGDIVYITDEYTGKNNLSDAWFQIQNTYDNYCGWVDKRNVISIIEKHIKDEKYIVRSPVTYVYLDNQPILIPAASRLIDTKFNTDCHEIRIANQEDITPFLPYTTQSLNRIIQIYRNAPYQWGGKSILGLDCSGFVQNVFSFFNIRLPRDASVQAGCGSEIAFEDIHTGDLCFFSDKKHSVNHVAIYIGDNRAVHCSAKVHTDCIDAEGIYIYDGNSCKQYSHRLTSVRRILQ